MWNTADEQDALTTFEMVSNVNDDDHIQLQVAVAAAGQRHGMVGSLVTRVPPGKAVLFAPRRLPSQNATGLPMLERVPHIGRLFQQAPQPLPDRETWVVIHPVRVMPEE